MLYSLSCTVGEKSFVEYALRHLYVHGCYCIRMKMPRSSKGYRCKQSVGRSGMHRKIQDQNTLGFGLG